MQILQSRISLAGRRRRDLLQAMTELETSVAGPSASEGWLNRVDSSLRDLLGALHAHISEVEGPDGLLAQILNEAPRLAGSIEGFRRDHTHLLDAVDDCRKAVRVAQSAGDLLRVRRKATTLLGRLTFHRQQGSDLVYEAYNVDIAAGD